VEWDRRQYQSATQLSGAFDGVGVCGYATITGTAGVAVSTSSGTGVYGEGHTGVTGYPVQSDGAGGYFTNMYPGGQNPNAVGVWEGSYYGDIVQGNELGGGGSSLDLRFRVTCTGNVYVVGVCSTRPGFVGGGRRE
jgi:hypothetical protein